MLICIFFYIVIGLESKGKNRVKEKETTLDSCHKLITSFFSLRKGIHEKLRDNNFYAHFKFSPRGIITLNFPFRKTRQKHAIEHAPNPIHSERYLLFVSPSTVGSDTLLEKSYRSVPTRIQGWGTGLTSIALRISPLVFLRFDPSRASRTFINHVSQRGLQPCSYIQEAIHRTLGNRATLLNRFSRPDKAERSVDYERRQLVRAGRSSFLRSAPCETFVTLSLDEKLRESIDLLISPFFNNTLIQRITCVIPFLCNFVTSL